MAWSGFTDEWLNARRLKKESRVEVKAQPMGRKRKPRPAEVIYPLIGLCRGMGLAEPVPEWAFHPTRKWRFDYAWPLHKVALEIEGGIWTEGRHTRGAGAMGDLEKYSEAAILGWRIVYCVPDDMLTFGMDRVQRALIGGYDGKETEAR